MAENGGLPDSGSLRVLSYHSIDTKPVDGDLTEYALSPEDFERQLLVLKRAGFTFVSPEQALALIEGRCALQRRSVLLSFDDGYSNFAEEAVPILESNGTTACRLRRDRAPRENQITGLRARVRALEDYVGG